jgi:uncharacterized protein YxeA
MEKWEIDFQWLKLRHFVKETFKTSSMPDLEAILFLVGIQEHGQIKKTFTKDKKMKLMQNAAAMLLSEEGYYTLKGNDEKGYQVWEEVKKIDLDEKAKADKLQLLLIAYFDKIIPEGYENSNPFEN